MLGGKTKDLLFLPLIKIIPKGVIGMVLKKFELTRASKLVKSMDFDFFAGGQYHIRPEKFFELLRNDEAVLLDVRSDKERTFVKFPFAIEIPFNELYTLFEESDESASSKIHTLLPTDKLIGILCTGKIRAAISWFILTSSGYNARYIDATIADFADFSKPGKLAKVWK